MTAVRELFGGPVGIILGGETFLDADLVMVGVPRRLENDLHGVKVLRLSGLVDMEFKNEFGARCFAGILAAMQDLDIDRNGGDIGG